MQRSGRVRRSLAAIWQTIRDQYSSLGLLRRQELALLSVTNLLDTMSGTIVVPLLPIYAATLGADPFTIGAIFAAPSVTKALLSVPFGYLSDRTARRPWILAGTVLGGLSVIGLAFAAGPLWLVGLRGLDGVGAAMKAPAANAYVGDLAADDERGRVFGAYHTLGRLGVVLGPAFGGALSVYGLAVPFLVLGVGTVLGGLLLVALPRHSTAGADEASGFGLQSDLSLSVPISALLADTSVSAIGTGAFDPLFPLLLSATVGGGPSYAALVWSGFGMAMLLFVPVGGTLADQTGRTRTIALGKLVWGVVLFGLVVAGHPAVPVALLFVAGIASALAGPAKGALTYELASDGDEATLVGINGAAHSAGRALGPLVGGFVAAWFGVTTAVAGIGVLWMLLIANVVLLVPEPGDGDEEIGSGQATAG